MAAYTTFLSAPPSVGNFLVGDTMTCPVTAPVQFWTYCGGGVWAPTPVLIKRFPDWPANTGILLASLAASSTAARTAGVVTVTATAHGIPTGTLYVGYRFYYPGSTNLVAGWYDSILTIPTANTITFSADGPDFASESINGGAAWVTGTDFINLTIPGNTLKDQSKVRLVHSRDGSNVSITKTLYAFFGGTQIAFATQTTGAKQESALTFRCHGVNKQVGQQGPEGGATSTAMVILTKDTTIDQVLTLRGAIAAASEYIALHGAYVEITQ